MKIAFIKGSLVVALVALICIVSLVGCGQSAPAPSAEASESSPAENMPSTEPVNEETTEMLSGDIIIDGSSTVFPITEAVAEEFRKIYPDVDIPIGVSGTGGGFKKFAIGETDISDASRPIKDEEAALAAENGIEYVELTVAYDGISVVVNAENDFVDSLTVEELNALWNPDSTVETWQDLRPEWPAEKIALYGPGTDSGTFDYFTEEIMGETGAIRTDFIPSEDDNVLVQGIAGDKNALGFFGFAYYIENTDKLKAVTIDGGNGPVAPSFESIADGSYSPLARPIFIYVSKASLEQAHVRTFVEYYLTEGTALIPEVGYVELDDAIYEEQLKKLD